MQHEYVAPSRGADGFNCPHCNAFAHQTWFRVQSHNEKESWGHKEITSSHCGRCRSFSFWRNEDLLFPHFSPAQLPSSDMPDEIKADYLEARGIAQDSPRGAAALLRLCVQKLMPLLGEAGKNINDDIAALVRKGLSPMIQKALDSVRVVGNQAVHPGELDLKDDAPVAITLFRLVNLIIEERITRPKQVEEVYNSLPKNQTDAINKRDGK